MASKDFQQLQAEFAEFRRKGESTIASPEELKAIMTEVVNWIGKLGDEAILAKARDESIEMRTAGEINQIQGDVRLLKSIAANKSIGGNKESWSAKQSTI